MKRQFLPPNRQGIIIDAIAIIANLVLFPIMLLRVGGLFQQSFADNGPAFLTLAGLMLFILAARLFGLYLKRFPLQSRLERSGQTAFPMYFFILNIGVFVLNAAFVITFVFAVAGGLGLVETNYNGQPKDSLALTLVGVFSMFALMCAEIVLIYRLSLPLSSQEKELRAEGNWMFDWRAEFAADFGLFSYMMVWQVFYNDTAKMMMTPPEGGVDSLEYRIFSGIRVHCVSSVLSLASHGVFDRG